MDKVKTIEHLKDLIKIDTTLGNEKQAADYLENLLKSYGIPTQQVEYSAGRHQLIATLEGQEKGKTLAISGHLDVVPVGQAEWQYPPFSATEVDGKIYGRGSSDMKGGTMAAVIAAIELKEKKTPLKGNLKLLLTVGEETSAIGAEQLTKLGYADDLDAMIIGEPSHNDIGYAHKGALWLRITTYGRSAHGSMPEEGVNAVEHMVDFIEAFRRESNFASIKDQVLGCPTASIDTISGGKGTNVIPDKCSIEIDMRTVPAQNHTEMVASCQKLIDKLAASIKGFKASIEVINDQMPVYTDPKDKLVEISKAAIEKIIGKTPQILASPGYTDASQFVKAKKKYPVLIIGPGIGQLAHQTNEYVEIKDYTDTIAIYEQIAIEFLK